MSSIGLLSLFSLFFLIGSSSSNEEHPSPYEALQQFNFPVGLLPQGAIGYDLNPSTGKFTAYLNDTCNFSLTNLYDLRYKNTISGVISKDHLKQLKGVSVRLLEIWLNIAEVRRHGDRLQFFVGIASAKFPVSSFEESPQCGCGFKCNTKEDSRKNNRVNQFVSSS